MFTPEASRAGRGLLNWSLRELARQSGVALETISRFEGGRSARSATVARLVEAFSRHGVRIVATKSRTGAELVYAERR